MIWTKRLSWLMVAWISAQAVAQMVVPGNEDDYSVERRDGIEFGMNIGVYRGAPAPAGIYDGYGKDGYQGVDLPDGAAQLWTIKRRLEQLAQFQQTNPIVGILNESPGWDVYSFPLMQYRPALSFGLKMAKFWNPETALVVSLDAVQLTAEGAWSLERVGVLPDQGQGNVATEDFGIEGKENRLNVCLGYRTSVYMQEGLSWIMEFGGLATAYSLEENYLLMAGAPGQLQPYRLDLLTMVNNGAGPLNRASGLLTQWGTGAYVGAGVDVAFQEGGRIELNLRVSRDNVKLGLQENKVWNGALFITWMIPSQIGDFVRASF